MRFLVGLHEEREVEYSVEVEDILDEEGFLDLDRMHDEAARRAQSGDGIIENEFHLGDPTVLLVEGLD